jgi:hypothetical protein
MDISRGKLFLAFEHFRPASKEEARGGNIVRPKILIAAGLVLAFVLGTMASGIYNSTTRAFNPADENAISPPSIVRSTASVNRTHFVQPRTVYVSNPAPAAAPVYQSPKKRSLGREALIVGGSAGAGAAIGAVAGGGKGAGIGAISGGVAGLIYDLATRNK